MKKQKKMSAEECIYSNCFGVDECLSFDKEKTIDKPRLLLHSCCGPCSTACIERIASDYNITIYFYNPNITDKNEYERRKASQIDYIKAYNSSYTNVNKIDFVEGTYDPWNFVKSAEKFKDEPEGGKRCGICFEMRLSETAQYASMHEYDVFGTTLTVSPHKDYPLISHIGKKLSSTYGIGFLDIDFKKKDGFKRSVELSKEYNLYRQNFCGCEYSKWEEKK